MRGRLCVLSRLRLIAPEGMGSECPDILVCGLCRMYFNDICELAKHKVECHGGTGISGSISDGGNGSRRSSQNSRSPGSSRRGSGARASGSVARASTGGRGSTGSNRASAGPRASRGSRASITGEQTFGTPSPPKGGSKRASATAQNARVDGVRVGTPSCSPMSGAAGTRRGSNNGNVMNGDLCDDNGKGEQDELNDCMEGNTGGTTDLCEEVDPCNPGNKLEECSGADGSGGEGDDEKVPEILAVGSVVPRDQHWYSPIGLEHGNRILICGRFRRENVVPIIDLWHNMDEQRVFFYSICFDDCRAVVGSKLDGKWVGKQAVPGNFPYELASDFTLELLVKKDHFTINWRGVRCGGTFDYPFNYDVTKVNMLRIQEIDMIYKIEKDWF